MKTLSRYAALAILMTACGSGSGPTDSFAGHWQGTIAPSAISSELVVTADITPISGAAGVYMGTLSTNVPRCFTNAMLSATATAGSLQLIATGAGTATQYSAIKITGQLNDAEIVGLFSMLSGSSDDCNVPETAFTLKRR